MILSNVSLTSAGSYSLVDSNASGTATSSKAVLTVTTNGPVMSVLLYSDQGTSSPYRTALDNLGRYGNSFGQSPRMRARWTQGLEPPVADIRRGPAEYLWFVGDYAS